jgi:predicted PurR-regulated permease PerM
VTKTVEQLATTYTQHPAKLLGPVSSIALGVANVIGAVIVVVITALYAAINPDPLVRGLVRLAPLERREEVVRVLGRIRAAWLGWLRGIALDMLVLGGLLFIGMKLIGLPFAVGFAVFSALMTVIPNYGSVISAVPPILLGLSQSLHEAVLVTVVYVVVNQIEGNLVLPLIMGRSVNVHPAVVAIAVLIAGALFGVIGLFLAIPLLSLTFIAIEEIWVLPMERRAARRELLSGAVTRATGPRAASDPSGAPRGQRAVFGAIFLGAVLVVLGLLVAQLLTLLLAVMVTIILSLPLAWCGSAFRRWRIPEPLGALIGLVAALAAVGGVLASLAPTIVSQVKTLADAAPGLVYSAEVQLGHLTGIKPGRVAAHVQHAVANYVNHPSHYLGALESVGLTATSIVAGMVIAVMTAYFIAAQPQPLIEGVVRLFSPAQRPEVQRVLRRLRTAVLGWMRGVLIAIVLIGALLYLALGLIVGLPFALFFAVLSGVAEVVPYLGSIATAIPPVGYALTISPTKALLVLAVYVAVHQVEANVIGPVVMARTVHLHPAVIALGVVAVGALFGFFGLLIAVPILASAIILVEEIWVRPRESRAVLTVTSSSDPEPRRKRRAHWPLRHSPGTPRDAEERGG